LKYWEQLENKAIPWQTRFLAPYTQLTLQWYFKIITGSALASCYNYYYYYYYYHHKHTSTGAQGYNGGRGVKGNNINVQNML